MIRFEHLSKHFGPLEAVHDLDFEIPRGSVFGFLGPNGAGKTTTLKMLMGMLPPTSGAAFIAGLDVSRDTVKVKQRVGYLPDNPALYEYLTARELLQFVGRLHRIPAAELDRRIPPMLERFALAPKADQLILNYSKGMKKKIAVVLALIHRPEVLLLDEPTNGLDPGSVRLLKDVVQETAREGTTILLSTHILDVAQEVSDHIGIIHKGRMVLHDEKEAILRDAAARGENLESVFLHLTGHASSRREPPSTACGTSDCWDV